MMSSIKKYVWRYGLIAGGIPVVYGFVLFATDIHFSSYASRNKEILVMFITIIPMIVLGIRNYKKASNSKLKLGTAVKIGVLIAMIAAVMFVLYNFFFISVLNPDYYDELYYGVSADESFQHYLNIDPETHTRESYDVFASEAYSREFEFMYPFVLIYNLFFGLITALIAGAILKRTK